MTVYQCPRCERTVNVYVEVTGEVVCYHLAVHKRGITMKPQRQEAYA